VGCTVEVIAVVDRLIENDRIAVPIGSLYGPMDVLCPLPAKKRYRFKNKAFPEILRITPIRDGFEMVAARAFHSSLASSVSAAQAVVASAMLVRALFARYDVDCVGAAHAFTYAPPLLRLYTLALTLPEMSATMEPVRIEAI